MDAANLIAALDLPTSATVGRRVPKKLLLQNGAPTATDKRHISEGIEELLWEAALKPTTVGIPEYRDEAREYLEIAVLRLTLCPGARATRLTQLVHRAVPYPVMLFAEGAGALSASVAHKRWSQAEAGRVVLDGEPVVAERDGDCDAHWPALCRALAIGRQPRATLFSLYQGWLDTLLALRAARITGAFGLLPTSEQAAGRREALVEYARLETEIARLRAAAQRETQMPRRVGINLELQRLRAAQAAARTKL